MDEVGGETRILYVGKGERRREERHRGGGAVGVRGRQTAMVFSFFESFPVKRAQVVLVS